jgi:hypothetical protein
MANCAWLRNDGGFILLNDGVSILLMNDDSCLASTPDPEVPADPSPQDTAGTTTGAGGFAKAWDDHWREKEKRDARKRHLLALVRSSDDYRRLKRKLAMLAEHLLDAKGSRAQTIKVNEKIAEIEAQIEMMERLE